MIYSYFYLPFLILSIVIVGMATLAQKHFKVKPNIGIPFASCIIALVFAVFGVLGARLVLDAHFSWATLAELIHVYKTASFGIIYGILMGIPLYKVGNNFAHRTSETTNLELATKFIGVCFLISIGLCYVSFYYMVWQMI